MSLLWDYNFYIGKNIGKYKVKDVLGVGGMGVVYKAEHIYLNTEVAIKLLLPNESGKDWHKRFLREARVLAELKHPNIIEIYDFDFTEEGYPYYVMELLDGISLKDYLIENGPPDFDRFKEICIQISEALFYAHSKGIIHRDLKPSNIFLNWENNKLKVKILDFGIAKLIANKEETMTLTKTTDFLGTPYYVAPEQVLNQDIGPHTDIYSFGLIAAEMLTGKPVRDEKSLGEILGVEIRKPVELLNLDGIPYSVIRAIFLSTMPSIEARFKDAKSFVNAMFDTECPETNYNNDNFRTTTYKEGIYTPQKNENTVKILRTRVKRKTYILTIVISIAIILSTLFLKQSHKKENKNPEKNNLVLQKKQFEVPPDSSFFIGSTEKALLLSTVNSIYSIPFKGKGKLWLIDVIHKEDIIGFDREGNVFFKNSNSLYQVSLPSKKKKLILKQIPDLDLLKVSFNGEIIAGSKKNTLNVYSIKNKKLTKLFSSKLPFSPYNLVLNKDYIFIFSNNAYAAFSVKNGKKIIEKKLEEIIGTPIATIQKRGHFVAFSGWSDNIFLIDLKSKTEKKIVVGGKTTSLLFIPDTNSLLITKENKLSMYRNGQIQTLSFENAIINNVEVIPGGFCLLDVLNNKILFVSYAEIEPLRIVKLPSLDLWSMAHFKEKVFVGSRDGKVFQINSVSHKVKEIFTHNEGVTSILKLKNFLITASDDRTIGVFSLPDAKLIKRTRAHTYLINYLFARGNTNNFWSSSSDGTIRKWVLPELKQKDIITSSNPRYSFAAFHIVNNLLIAGTWNNKLVIYSKKNKTWKFKKEYKVNSNGIYTMCYLKELNLIVAAGISPCNLYLLNLDNFCLYSIPEGKYNFWLIKSGDRECIVLANGIITRFVFEKKDKSVYYSKYTLINTNMSILTTGTLSDKFLAAGNTNGKVFFFKKSKLPFNLETTSEAEKIF